MQKNGAVEEIKKLIESVYLVNDPYITEVMLAGIISHRIQSDPVWIIVVGPSGGGKSEFINLTSKVSGVLPLSTLTSHTFVSGQKKGGKDQSLLTIMQNGIITFKDMTSLLSENKEERGVIMAQLREIYDGKYVKAFGTGENVNWSGKITVLAGATYAIHTMKQAYSAMGERFLMYNMIQPDRIDAARRTMENQEEGLMAQKREQLAEAFRKLVDETFEIPDVLPKIPKELQDDLLALAELATRARSETERNWKSTQMEITEVHPPEMPTRFAGQLQNFLRALMIVHYNETGRLEVTDRHLQILKKLALDSITKSKRIAMQELAKYNMLETAGLAMKINLPTNTVRRWLEDLNALGVTERVRGSGSKGDKWKILPVYKSVMMKFDGVLAENSDLTERSAENREAMLDEVRAAKEFVPATSRSEIDPTGFFDDVA